MGNQSRSQTYIYRKGGVESYSMLVRDLHEMHVQISPPLAEGPKAHILKSGGGGGSAPLHGFSLSRPKGACMEACCN